MKTTCVEDTLPSESMPPTRSPTCMSFLCMKCTYGYAIQRHVGKIFCKRVIDLRIFTLRSARRSGRIICRPRSSSTTVWTSLSTAKQPVDSPKALACSWRMICSEIVSEQSTPTYVSAQTQVADALCAGIKSSFRAMHGDGDVGVRLHAGSTPQHGG